MVLWRLIHEWIWIWIRSWIHIQVWCFMVAVRGNFPGGSSTVQCLVPGCSENELPQHTFVCPFLSTEGDMIDDEVSYFEMFTDNTKKQWQVSQIFFVRFQRRNSFLSGKEPADPRVNHPCDPREKAPDGSYDHIT